MSSQPDPYSHMSIEEKVKEPIKVKIKHKEERGKHIVADVKIIIKLTKI